MPCRLLRPRTPIDLLRDRSGATAVEFGLVAVPFLALVLGIFELALIFLVSGTLDTATAAVARESSMLETRPTTAAVAERICATMPSFGRACDTALEVNVSEFAAAAGQSDIVVIRAVYDWPLLSPLVGRALPSGDGSLSFIATSAFRLEGS
jgi:Flp pilus assembly protein TadG